MNKPTLGAIINDPSAQRDAVHVAIYPAIAAQTLYGGQDVIIVSGEAFEAATVAGSIGVIDPFLTTVKEGERCWVFIKPNEVKNLRHEWDHPLLDMDIEQIANTAGDPNMDDGCRGCNS
jgi:hypothetical protein